MPPRSPGLIVLDEPETGVNEQTLACVSELMLGASRSVQSPAVAHSEWVATLLPEGTDVRVARLQKLSTGTGILAETGSQ